MSSRTTRSQSRASASASTSTPAGPAPTKDTTSTQATAQLPTLIPETEMGPVYFWREYGSPHDFLSQWYPSAFTAPEVRGGDPNNANNKEPEKITFLTTEQYMMYHKATLFADSDIATKILRESEPKKQKALGRKVKGFDPKIWDENKEGIVEEGNWWKFMSAKGDPKPGKKTPLIGDPTLKQRLLDTGDRELVEASPFDRIWGIGYSAANADANREVWGENLLGKALMRVRGRIRGGEVVEGRGTPEKL